MEISECSTVVVVQPVRLQPVCLPVCLAVCVSASQRLPHAHLSCTIKLNSDHLTDGGPYTLIEDVKHALSAAG